MDSQLNNPPRQLPENKDPFSIAMFAMVSVFVWLINAMVLSKEDLQLAGVYLGGEGRDDEIVHPA